MIAKLPTYSQTAKAFALKITEVRSHDNNILKDLCSKDEMPWALDNGSQPYRNALGCFEMAGEGDTHTRNLAFR